MGQIESWALGPHMGHFSFTETNVSDLDLRPKTRSKTQLNAIKLEVLLSFGLRPKSQIKFWSETKLNLGSSVLDQSIVMHLDRQIALIH